MELQDIYLHLRRDIEKIEQELTHSIHTEQTTLQHAAHHLLKAGGKRMRPVFVLLSGRFGTYHLENISHVAVALELIHMASLVHDDVIDNARTRRGKETVKAKWSNQTAMYTGDFIFARALQKIAQIKDSDVQAILSNAMMKMCEGEIEQIEDIFAPDQSLKRYLRRIKRKTALLMSVSCQLGAIVSGARDRDVKALAKYGYYVGMAFQLTDDVLDLTGDEKVLGKPAGSDLRQGNITLPVTYALHHATEQDQTKILTYIQSKGTQGALNEVLDIVRTAGGIEETLQLSTRYLKKALHALALLPDSLERQSLQLIGEFIVRRSY
ncbi:polyprenyl synthetase family protein [Hazenella sp. IB182357]|uniref:Polyprenyl synthetase family protein n=1 Tax=Polycladospora coralii TaxID=2771432 RepID=A0A926N656_9BACL|nr:polyprenyl synthetase family protein [Polycladospora coralii]MBD1371621.1 polyprenyl synthetase family protein [Polycladospora coralii]MBS7529088.1 polyprenyl synthetase family protein [Polycladospora coralii]